ncbi:MAG: methyltransferase domain-containing protein [Candidatus Thermoplasmatota archaeon]|jgi:alkylated DNA repair protein alkB family protein 8|nr:methyltransferase domain-containing protein [Candidatus Thermoplasmatota archaeon]
MSENKIKTVEETWDAIAESFDKTRNKPWDICLDFIKTLKKTDVVADIGCGNGRHLIPCAKQCKNAIGVDISSKLLGIIKKKLLENNLKNTVLLYSDATSIPIKDGSVDAVIFVASLHNIKGRDNRVKALKEIKRVMKKGGKALISVWSRWQDKYRKQFFKKWFTQIGKSEFGDIDICWRQHGLDIPRFYHLYSRKEFIDDIKKSGLKIEKIENIKIASKKYPDNYFVVVTKP